MNIWLSAIMGVVTGDALGCPVQFESRETVARHPVTDMRGYGTFNLPAGSWTDDSSLTLALLESLRRVGRVDLRDIMNNFVLWVREGRFTPYGYAYDIGNGTIDAIHAYMAASDPYSCGGRSEWNNGNGSLMRIMPAVLYALAQEMDEAEAYETISRVGSLTHAHVRANIACGLYYFVAREILRGAGTLPERLKAGLERGFRFFEARPDTRGELGCFGRLRAFDAFTALPEREIRSSGYVVDTLEAALWALARTQSFRDALLKCVNLGDDSDTVGAVAGGLAGLAYGYEAIPETWLAALPRRAWIEEMCRF